MQVPVLSPSEGWLSPPFRYTMEYMQKVYLAPAQISDSHIEIARKIDLLWESARLKSSFQQNDLTALKLHVGEPGRTTFVSPRIVAPLVRCLKSAGTRPFLTDTAVLYKSPRDNGVTHTQVAHDHGFTVDSVGAPFLPADGLNGSDEVGLPVEGKHFQSASIAAAIVQARSMLVLSHATGHLATGFGGAIKNLGMGCSSKKAKLRQHFGQEPRINQEICTGCEECALSCPENAIEVEGTAAIETARCIGCGSCIAACLEGAVQFDWEVMGGELQERVVEHALSLHLQKSKKIAYITVAMDITKDCDCLNVVQDPVCEDIGILASRDPVAIDQAVLNLIRERTGQTLESISYPDRDGSIQLEYAEKLGLGRRAHQLVTVE